MALSTTQLYMLADSALPIGGFAYSYGMESAVKHGLITNENALFEYLQSFADQMVSFDLPFVKSAYENTSLHELSLAYEAMLLNPMVRKANLSTGKSWIKILQTICGDGQFDQIMQDINEAKLSSDFPLLFGHSMQMLAVPLKDAFELYAYMGIRDQISSIVRLGSLGPLRGQKMLFKLQEYIAEKLQKHSIGVYYSATKSAYCMEITQMMHETIYAKLFQN